MRAAARSTLIVSLLAGAVACGDKSPTSPSSSQGSSSTSATCNLTVGDPPAGPVAAAGQDFTINVTANGTGCSWTASSAAPFIAVNGTASGTGSGSVRFTVQANAGEARQGSIAVANRTLTVAQAAGATQSLPCELNISPADASVGAAAADVSVAVTAAAGSNCAWTATSSSPFISVKSGASGIDGGAAVLSVAANSGAARVGTASVAGRTVTIAQSSASAGTCEFSVSPQHASVPANGGSVSVTITNTAGSGCAWVASSQTSFMTISGSNSGSGHGVVTLALGANPGGTARTASATVANQSVTVTQPVATTPCTFSLSPSFVNAPAAGGTFTVQVQSTQGADCAWTASTLSSWAVITAGAAGTGSGTVTVSVPANTGPERSANVRIAGMGFSIHQASGQTCRFAVSPLSASVPSAGQFVRITVTNTEGMYCPWEAVPSELWLGFLQGTRTVTGYGSSWFDVIVGRNIGPARSATMVVAGQTVTISQAAQTMPDNAAAVISFQSEPGDYIGQGQSSTHTYIGPAQFAAQFDATRGQLTFGTSVGAQPSTSAGFQSPMGVALAPGVFTDAERWPFQPATKPGLSVGAFHRGCNQSRGRFVIGELVTGPNGEVQRFHASFEQRCEFSSAALRGSIWIDAQGSTTPPPAPPLPPIAGPSTLFSYTSDPGDTIGGGGSGSFSLANSVFSASGDFSSASITIRPPSGFAYTYTLHFRAPNGQTLGLGTYDSATNSGSGSAPTLIIGGFGCTTTVINSRFTILEYSYRSDTGLRILRATFEARCGPATPAFRGEIVVATDPWR